jgi:tetratricopeptide (TPR) repeat protein
VFKDNIGALTNRGYMNLIGFETEKAKSDFERIRELDPQYSLNYLNLAVTYANLKDYSAAENAIDRAIEWYRPGFFDGVFDSEVSEDIRQATHRNVIYADGTEFNAALHYERAGLEAFRGGRDFEARLKEADEVAGRTGSQVEGYLTALNWAWLQLRKYPQDYGAWAIQAHLWAKAGYNDWARYYYLKFQCEHDKQKDARYQNLSAWVKTQLRSLPKSEVELDCSTSPRVQSNRRMQVLEAQRLASIGRYTEAVKAIDPEIQRDPDNIDLLLARARHRERAGYWAGYWNNEEEKKKQYEGARDDFAKMLKLADNNPSYKPIVFLWWSFLGHQLGAISDSDKERYFPRGHTPGAGEFRRPDGIERCAGEQRSGPRHRIDEARHHAGSDVRQLLQAGQAAERSRPVS